MVDSALETEQALIGAVFLSPDMVELVAGKVNPHCFSVPAWGHVYRGILHVIDKGGVPDPITVAGVISADVLNTIGGRSALSDTMNLAVSGVAAIGYAEQVRKEYERRSTREYIYNASESLTSGADPIDIGQGLVASLETIGESDDTLQATSIKDIVRAHADTDCAPATISTGYSQMDRLHGGGLEPDSFTVVAAAPSVGKSQFVMNLMRKCKRADGLPAHALFVSQEMGEQLVFDRMVAMACRLDSLLVRAFRTNQIKHGDPQYAKYGRQYISGCEAVYDVPMTVYAKQTLKPTELRALVARYHKDVDYIVVDYLQLCRAEQGQDEKSLASEASKTCKDLAKRYRKPVIGICSLNRKGYSNPDEAPRMFHMKESGNIEFDADNVWMLWRERDPGAVKEQLDLYIRKQRQGPLDRLRFDYQLDTGVIEEYSGDTWDGKD